MDPKVDRRVLLCKNGTKVDMGRTQYVVHGKLSLVYCNFRTFNNHVLDASISERVFVLAPLVS